MVLNKIIEGRELTGSEKEKIITLWIKNTYNLYSHKKKTTKSFSCIGDSFEEIKNYFSYETYFMIYEYSINKKKKLIHLGKIFEVKKDNLLKEIKLSYKNDEWSSTFFMTLNEEDVLFCNDEGTFFKIDGSVSSASTSPMSLS